MFPRIFISLESLWLFHFFVSVYKIVCDIGVTFLKKSSVDKYHIMN